jgi:hypothetical protein
MTETQHPPRIARSIVALLAGIFAGVILTVVTDIVLHVTGVFPPWAGRRKTRCSCLRRSIEFPSTSRGATLWHGSRRIGLRNTLW